MKVGDTVMVSFTHPNGDVVHYDLTIKEKGIHLTKRNAPHQIHPSGVKHDNT